MAASELLPWTEITNLNERDLKQYARQVGVSTKQGRTEILDDIYGQVKYDYQSPKVRSANHEEVKTEKTKRSRPKKKKKEKDEKDGSRKRRNKHRRHKHIYEGIGEEKMRRVSVQLNHKLQSPPNLMDLEQKVPIDVNLIKSQVKKTKGKKSSKRKYRGIDNEKMRRVSVQLETKLAQRPDLEQINNRGYILPGDGRSIQKISNQTVTEKPIQRVKKGRPPKPYNSKLEKARRRIKGMGQDKMRRVSKHLEGMLKNRPGLEQMSKNSIIQPKAKKSQKVKFTTTGSAIVFKDSYDDKIEFLYQGNGQWVYRVNGVDFSHSGTLSINENTGEIYIEGTSCCNDFGGFWQTTVPAGCRVEILNKLFQTMKSHTYTPEIRDVIQAKKTLNKGILDYEIPKGTVMTVIRISKGKGIAVSSANWTEDKRILPKDLPHLLKINNDVQKLETGNDQIIGNHNVQPGQIRAGESPKVPNDVGNMTNKVQPLSAIQRNLAERDERSTAQTPSIGRHLAKTIDDEFLNASNQIADQNTGMNRGTGQLVETNGGKKRVLNRVSNLKRAATQFTLTDTQNKTVDKRIVGNRPRAGSLDDEKRMIQNRPRAETMDEAELAKRRAMLNRSSKKSNRKKKQEDPRLHEKRIMDMLKYIEEKCLMEKNKLIAANHSMGACIEKMSNLVDHFAYGLIASEKHINEVPTLEINQLKKHLARVIQRDFQTKAELNAISANSNISNVAKVADFERIQNDHLLGFLKAMKHKCLNERKKIVLKSASENECIQKLIAFFNTLAFELISQDTILNELPQKELDILKSRLITVYKKYFADCIPPKAIVIHGRKGYNSTINGYYQRSEHKHENRFYYKNYNTQWVIRWYKDQSMWLIDHNGKLQGKDCAGYVQQDAPHPALITKPLYVYSIKKQRFRRDQHIKIYRMPFSVGEKVRVKQTFVSKANREGESEQEIKKGTILMITNIGEVGDIMVNAVNNMWEKSKWILCINFKYLDKNIRSKQDKLRRKESADSYSSYRKDSGSEPSLSRKNTLESDISDITSPHQIHYLKPQNQTEISNSVQSNISGVENIHKQPFSPSGSESYNGSTNGGDFALIPEDEFHKNGFTDVIINSKLIDIGIEDPQELLYYDQDDLQELIKELNLKLVKRNRFKKMIDFMKIAAQKNVGNEVALSTQDDGLHIYNAIIIGANEDRFRQDAENVRTALLEKNYRNVMCLNTGNITPKIIENAFMQIGDSSYCKGVLLTFISTHAGRNEDGSIRFQLDNGTEIHSDEFGELFRYINCNKKLTLVHSCFAGGYMPVNNSACSWEERVGKRSGSITFTACSGDELSWGNVYSEALVSKLEKCDPNEGLTWAELTSYIAHQVDKKFRSFGPYDDVAPATHQLITFEKRNDYFDIIPIIENGIPINIEGIRKVGNQFRCLICKRFKSTIFQNALKHIETQHSSSNGTISNNSGSHNIKHGSGNQMQNMINNSSARNLNLEDVYE